LWESTLLDEPPDEVLIVGPAGTGKTRSVSELINYWCFRVPGIRVLVARYTLSRLRESFQVTFEEKCLHGSLAQFKNARAGRHHRQSYDYHNGSEIVLGGLQPSEIERTFSTEYDIIYVLELGEIVRDSWEKLARANRNDVLRFQMRIGDMNPGPPAHWANSHFGSLEEGVRNLPAIVGRKLRLHSVHEDNPTLTPAYLRKLSNLTGSNRARLYLGEWAGSEGMIWPQYNPVRHLVERIAVNATEDAVSHYRDKASGKLVLSWYVLSCDWGWTNAGVVQVWGMSREYRMYRVAEIHRTEKTMDWWADRIVELVEEFDPELGWADSAEPDRIAAVNDRLRSLGTRCLLRRANKSLQTGLDLVRDALAGNRMFFVTDAIRGGKDPALVEKFKPTCTEEEIPSYVFEDVDPDAHRDDMERPKRGTKRDGCDATRYACMGAFKTDLSPQEEFSRFAPGTFGEQFDAHERLGVF